MGQDLQDLQDLFLHFQFPEETENIQSPSAKGFIPNHHYGLETIICEYSVSQPEIISNMTTAIGTLF